MGQQQLLLLVLGVVIVGMAMVSGIQVFAETRMRLERDLLVSEAMDIIVGFQAWKHTPRMLGGGREGAGFKGVTFHAIGRTQGVNRAGTRYYNQRHIGCYVLNSSRADRLVLDIYRNDDVRSCLDGRTGGSANRVARALVTGLKHTDIAWTFY